MQILSLESRSDSKGKGGWRGPTEILGRAEIFVVKGISRKTGPCQTPYHPSLVNSGGL